MSWENVLKKSWTPEGCDKRKKLTPKMQKDIEFVVRKVIGEQTTKDKIEEILDINSFEIEPLPKKKILTEEE
tara:strand:- start:247 stop:462 length:216 start_codon:yes stop_codon:yes gene_type:complete